MARALVLLALLAACGSERSPVTAKVTTLGYSHPPAIVVIARGKPDLVAPWVASLRASTAATVVAELAREETPASPDSEAANLCRDAREAANGEPLDEIVVIDVLSRNIPFSECIDTGCAVRRYHSMTVFLDTKVTAYRASSCELARATTTMPTSRGDSAPLPDRPDGYEEEKEAADTAEASAKALAFMQRTAEHTAWKVFPRDWSIQRIEGRTMVIAGPLATGEYFLKTPSKAELHPGIRAVSSSKNQTTFEIDPELKPEGGDELHTVKDMLTVAGYTAITVGEARVQGGKHAVAGASLVARWSWDHYPAMFELQLDGDLVPGVDSRRVGIGFAGGLRWPRRYVSPVAFVEVGLGAAYQGDHGGRAAGGHVGAGAGLELRLARWFMFANMRVRGVYYGDYTNSKDEPREVSYPDHTWRTTTGQLGVGFNF